MSVTLFLHPSYHHKSPSAEATPCSEKMSPRAQNTRRFLLLAVVAAIVGLVIGLLIGRFGIRSDNDDYRITGISETFVQDADPTISEEIMDNINSDNIRQYLR